MLVGIAYQKAYGASGRFAFEHSGQQFHLVRFFAGSRDSALSRTTAVQLVLYEVLVDVDAGRKPVDDSAYSRPVAFSESRQLEYITKCIAHVSPFQYKIYRCRF